MNRIYRLVWNRTLNAFVVGSELASAHGKSSGALKLSAPVGPLGWTSAAGMLALVMTLPAHASDKRLDDLQSLVAKYSSDESQQVLQHLPVPVAKAGAGAAVSIAVPSLIRADVAAAAKVHIQTPAKTAAARPTLQVAAKLRANIDVPVAGKVIGEVAHAAAPVVQLLSGAAPSAPTGGGKGGLVNGLTNLLSPGKEENGAPVRDTVTGVLGVVTGLAGTANDGNALSGLVEGLGDGAAPLLGGLGTVAGGVVAGVSGSASGGAAVVAGVTDIAGAVHATTDALANVLSSGKPQSAPVLGGVQQLVGGVTGVVEGAGNAGGGLVTAVTGSTQLGGVVSGTVAGVAGGVQRVVGALGEVTAPGAGGSTPALGGVQQLVGGLTGALQGGTNPGQAVSEVLNAVGTVGGSTVTAVTGSSQLGGTVSGTVAGVAGGAQQLLGGLTDGLQGGDGNGAGASLGGLLDGVGGVVGGVLTGVTGSTQLGGTVSSTVGVVADGVEQVTGALTGAAVSGGQGSNPLAGAVTGVVGAVTDTVGGVVGTSGVGSVVDGVVGGAAPVVDGLGQGVGQLVTGVTGSSTLGNGLDQSVDTLTDGLQQTTGALAGGDAVGAVQDLLGTVDGTANAVLDTVGSTLGGLTGSTSGVGGLTGTLGNVVSGVTGGVSNAVGQLTGAPAAAPAAPVPPPPAAGGSLIVGNGGAVGTVGQILAPTLSSVLGGNGYVQNGSLTVNSANIAQGYTVVSVLGLPTVNLSPVGELLDGVGGLATGSNSHLTLLGGVTSDSYIYNINNGDPNGLLGLLLPDEAPAWASTCANLLGLAQVDCWGINAAQDYQVLIGDGAFANGSKEVVIGTNAQHRLAMQDANDVFTGDGVNDPDNPTGVPTADYDARLGHSVVIGDSAIGTANGQTLLGAGATSDKANSVALGYKSNAERGGVDNYTAFGLSATQSSIGEVAVGSAGRERQVTHVAAGSQATDAVNVAQLQGAISQINDVSLQAVLYDLDANGNVDYTRVSLGGSNATVGTTLDNLADGALAAGSMQAVNGGQIQGMGQSLAGYIGAGAAFLADGTFSAPTFKINSISMAGQASLQDYLNFDSAFTSISDSLLNLSARLPAGGDPLAVLYSADGAGNPLNEVNLLGDGSGATVALRNVAAGAISVGGTDAVNGGQLFGLGQSMAAHLGGGATLSAGGVLTAPSYQIAGIDMWGGTAVGNFGNIGVAFDSISDSLVNLRNLISPGGNNGGGGFDPLNVQYSADTNGEPINEVYLVGAGNGEAVAVRNLAAGEVASGSLDAVNGGQLASTNAAISQAIGGTMSFDASTGLWTAPSFAVTSVTSSGDTNQVVLDNVTDALAAMDSSIVNVNNRIDNIQNGGAGSAYYAVNSTKPAASATGQDAVAAGPQATASGNNAVAIGNGASASATDSVALGAGSIADRANTVSVGAAGKERQVTNVADGTEATDAVNVRQLEASQQGTVRYDQNTDGSTNYGSVTMGRSGTSTVIHNVGTGTAPTDAVNVAQLNKGLGDVMDWSKNYTDQRFNDITRDIKRVDDRASAGIASAMAMAGLPQPSEAGRRMASFAASSFHGESSMAVGISGVSDGGRWIYKLSGSANTRGDGGVTVGAGFQW